MSQDVTRDQPVQGVLNPPQLAPPANHGRTVAGWALFWMVALGALIIGIGAIINTWPVIIAGAIVCVGGPLLGLVLRALGHGQPRIHRPMPTLTDPR